MGIDPTIDERFSLFLDEERRFLKKVFPQYPKIEANFIAYLDKPSGNLRFEDAVADLKKLPRAGWVKRKIRNPETVAEHTLSMLYTARIISPPPRMLM